MTIQQVIINEQEINELVMAGKSMDAFHKYYGEDVVMIESDGYTTTGKAACQTYEEAYEASIIEFNGCKVISSVVLESTDPKYEFLVVATWFWDFKTTEFPFKGNQTSFTYWKDNKIQKVQFKSPSEIIV